MLAAMASSAVSASFGKCSSAAERFSEDAPLAAWKQASRSQSDAAHALVHGYTRQVLRKRFEAGLITRELYDTLQRESFYVPLYRDMKDKPKAGKAGGGANADGPGMTDTIKRIKGSDRDAIDPIQNLMTQTFLVNRTVQHNDIVRSFVELSRKARAAGATETGRIVEEIPAHQIVGQRFDLAETVKAAARQNGLDELDTKVLLGSLSDVFGEDPIMGSIFRAEPAGKSGEPIVFYKEAGQLKAARVEDQILVGRVFRLKQYIGRARGCPRSGISHLR
jgi:hypothetical protein